MENLPSFINDLYSDIKPSYNDSLMHYGIKGMKWGVRRYQNPDGRLTAQGRKRRSANSELKRDMAKILGYSIAAGTIAAAGSLYTQSIDMENNAKILNGPAMDRQVASVTKAYKSYSKMAEDFRTGKIKSSQISSKTKQRLEKHIDKNLEMADNTVRMAERRFEWLKSGDKGFIYKHSSRKREIVNKAAKKINLLKGHTELLHMHSETLKRALNGEYD